MSELELLAAEYRDACKAMSALWYAVMKAYPSTVDRDAAIRLHTQGRERCEAARKNLLEYVARGYTETGTQGQEPK
jgi:hypothetical protein